MSPVSNVLAPIQLRRRFKRGACVQGNSDTWRRPEISAGSLKALSDNVILLAERHATLIYTSSVDLRRWGSPGDLHDCRPTSGIVESLISFTTRLSDR